MLLGLLLAAAAASPAEILNDRVAVLEPFPREVLRGKTLVVKGVVKAPFKDPELILIGSGSEVHLLLAAQDQLKTRGIAARVVSVPSWELFDRQPAEYKEMVLPSRIRARLAVEAGCSFGWEKFVGLDGDSITIDRFGESAPDKVLFKEFGFTVDNVVKKAEALLNRK